jgi:hypothetical protein
MSRLPHFLVNRLTDGGEDVSFARRPRFTLRNIPGSHRVLVNPRTRVRLDGLDKFKKVQQSNLKSKLRPSGW